MKINSQLDHVTDEENVDWSKLDVYAIKIAKTFNHTASMFGTFDFDYVADGTQAVQKERKVRRKVDPGVEKRPMTVAQSEDTETKTTKVEQVLEKIKEVSQFNTFYRAVRPDLEYQQISYL